MRDPPCVAVSLVLNTSSACLLRVLEQKRISVQFTYVRLWNYYESEMEV